MVAPGTFDCEDRHPSKLVLDDEKDAHDGFVAYAQERFKVELLSSSQRANRFICFESIIWFLVLVLSYFQRSVGNLG